jgi:hypothetical protein
MTFKPLVAAAFTAQTTIRVSFGLAVLIETAFLIYKLWDYSLWSKQGCAWYQSKQLGPREHWQAKLSG